LALSRFENRLLKEVSVEEPCRLIDTFSGLIRECGSEGERQAAEYITNRLRELNIPTDIYEPNLYLSVPKHVSLEITHPESRELRHQSQIMNPKVMSMSPSVDWELQVIHVPAKRPTGISDFFNSGINQTDLKINGLAVLTEGLSIMPAMIKHLERQGARAVICITPGERTHAGISTSIWGTPTLENINEKPQIPTLSIANSDGQYIKKLLNSGPLRIRIKTKLEEGWRKCLLPVASIKAKDTNQFLLLHGHLDSWFYGIGDNAVGDGGLLELARVFHKFRKQIHRGLRVAWWPGHSHGRYGGSTWYADNFALDLYENCVAQVNMDSPGCRGATAYEEVMWMDEAQELCREAIKDVTGIYAKGIRPISAGDYSFNGIGITSFYMLLSNIPEAVRREKSLYTVGGSGGNVEWHTEDDDMRLLDKEILLNDLRIYALTILRVLNAPILPFDFTKTIDNSIAIINDYRKNSKGKLNLDPVLDEARTLNRELHKFYSTTKALNKSKNRREIEKANKTIMRLGRALIPANYTEEGTLNHDMAVPIPPYPHMAKAEMLTLYPEDSDQHRFLMNQLVRKRNQLVNALRTAREQVARQ